MRCCRRLPYRILPWPWITPRPACCVVQKVHDVKGNERHILKGIDGYVEPRWVLPPCRVHAATGSSSGSALAGAAQLPATGSAIADIRRPLLLVRRHM